MTEAIIVALITAASAVVCQLVIAANHRLTDLEVENEKRH